MNNMHVDFKMNGTSFDNKDALLQFSSTISSSVFSFLSDWFDDSDVVIVHTSGSTGKPKKIQLKKVFMVNSALATGAYFKLPEKTTALLCLSTDYIAGKMMLVRALVLGWHLDVVEANSHPLNGIEKAYDFSAMVPLQLYNSIDKLESIKKMIVGGGVVSHDLQQKIRKLKTEIFATYGMTETITHIAVKKLTNFEHAKLDSAAYYQTLPNVKISIDARDCLVIDAPTISEHIISTNDLVELVSEYEFKWLGRYDTIINSGGVKLIPEQIEEKLAAIIDARFFVAGVVDPVLGEKLILIVESKKEDDRLLNLVKNLATVSKFEIPKEIYFIENFIETETKKIHRVQTLAQLSFL
jgi:O-succinylbenzoic acid--CoA ligase